MISYVILTDSQMAETQDKDEAARTCLRVGVPHFYEVDSSGPYDPKTGLGGSIIGRFVYFKI